MSGDWDRLSEGEKDARREEEFDFAHPECAHCHQRGCVGEGCPSYTCCGLPPLRRDIDDRDVFVHEGCVENWIAATAAQED